MAPTKGTNASLFVDEFKFDSATAKLTVDINVGEGSAMSLASTGEEYAALLGTMRIMQDGYVQGFNADEFEAELYDRLGVTGVVVSALFGTQNTACPAYIIPDAFDTKMEFAAPIKDVMTLNGEWAASDDCYRGIRIVDQVTISATGAEDAIDLETAGSNGGLFVVHVTAITGSATDAMVKLQSASTEGGSYSDEATVTFSDVGGFTAVVSDAVDRWVRLNCTSLGGATSFVVTAIACVDGVTM